MNAGLLNLPEKSYSKKSVFLENFFYNFFFLQKLNLPPNFMTKIKVNHLMISKKEKILISKGRSIK